MIVLNFSIVTSSAPLYVFNCSEASHAMLAPCPSLLLSPSCYILTLAYYLSTTTNIPFHQPYCVVYDTCCKKKTVIKIFDPLTLLHYFCRSTFLDSRKVRIKKSFPNTVSRTPLLIYIPSSKSEPRIR